MPCMALGPMIWQYSKEEGAGIAIRVGALDVDVDVDVDVVVVVADSFACTIPPPPLFLPPHPKNRPPRLISPILIGILQSKV
jgi:hypothetical protein